MSQADEDRFFEVLEGRADGDAETSGARVLRQAVEARAETLQEIAELGGPSVASAEQSEGVSARRQALFGKLQSMNAFIDLPAELPPGQTAKAHQSNGPNTPSLLERCVALFGDSWLRPLSLAAVLALVVGIIVQQAGFDQQADERTIVRGALENAVVAERPAQFVADLATRLEARGAFVVVAQINDHEWNLSVEVPATADRAPIRELLRDAGFRDIEVGSTNKLVVREVASPPASK